MIYKVCVCLCVFEFPLLSRSDAHEKETFILELKKCLLTRSVIKELVQSKNKAPKIVGNLA